MAGYPYLSQVQDPAAVKALKAAFDQIAALQTRLTALEAAAVTRDTTVDAGGLRVSSVATPTAETDAVTVGFMRQYVQAQVDTF